jgi:hypothetical protein
MSIEMLLKTPIKSSGNPNDVFCHGPKHDLESLFYVLLYISTFFIEPHQRLQSAQLREIHTSVPLLEWVDPEAYSKTFRSMGCLKTGHMANFESAIIAKIAPFFQPIASHLIKLRDIFFPSHLKNSYRNNQMSYSSIVEVFDAMLEAISNAETPSIPDADADATRPRKKLQTTPNAIIPA